MANKPRLPIEHTVEYSTPWFDLVAKRVGTDPAPYYSLRMQDYVSVVALTSQREIIMVQQYRPAIEQHTLELPAGHVEPDLTPEESARRELQEETGFTTAQLTLLGTTFSDTGRHENKMWCYLAQTVIPPTAEWQPEDGIEVTLVPIDQLPTMLSDGSFNHALHIAALMLAAPHHASISNVLLSNRKHS